MQVCDTKNSLHHIETLSELKNQLKPRYFYYFESEKRNFQLNFWSDCISCARIFHIVHNYYDKWNENGLSTEIFLKLKCKFISLRPPTLGARSRELTRAGDHHGIIHLLHSFFLAVKTGFHKFLNFPTICQIYIIFIQ